MNLPNKLTLTRIFMIPLFIVVFYLDVIPYNYAISAAIFAIAAFTDYLDGHIARKYNLVTNLGKFLDPSADKVLVSTALILILVPVNTVLMPVLSFQFVAPLCVAIILARELIVSGFRLVAVGKGKVIAADKSGKIKTFITDIAIIVILVAGEITKLEFDAFNIVGLVLLIVSTLLTIYSGIECVIKNKEVLKD